MMLNTKRLSRNGATWPLLLGCLALILAGIALAVDSAMLWQARQELQVTADASVLAAAQEFTNDQLLLHREGEMQQAVLRAKNVATKIGFKHHVLGVPHIIHPDDSIQPDVVVGFYHAMTSAMHPAAPSDQDNSLLNAIEVTARRTRERGNPVGLFFTRVFRLPSADVSASAIAVLDRQIIGFRPLDQIHIPLMPIGLYSDPTGIDDLSWESQIDKPLTTGKSGSDQFAFDKENRKWFEVGVDTKVGDGLPEFTLKLPLSQDTEDANGCLLQLGKQAPSAIVRQMATGISARDLQTMQGKLELGWDGLLPLDEAAQPTGKQLTDIIEVMKSLQDRGEPRIWPLYMPGISNDSPTDAGHVMVRGFVAARIASIQLTETELEIVLQPTVLITGTALTHASADANVYLGKIKLVR